MFIYNLCLISYVFGSCKLILSMVLY